MTKETTTTLLPGDSIDNAFKLIGESGARLLEAADMIHRLAAADPSVIEKLTSPPYSLAENVLNGLLRVGGRELHPQLMLNRCPAYRRLANMSYGVQEAVIKKGTVELVVDAESGDVVKVDVVKLEGDQLNQVISHAGIRSRDEQRAWLKRRTIASAPKDVGPPYQIKRDELLILRAGFRFTRVELLRVLEQMVA